MSAITAVGLSLTTTADLEVEVELDRAADNLEGRMRMKNSGRYRAQPKRAQ